MARGDKARRPCETRPPPVRRLVTPVPPHRTGYRHAPGSERSGIGGATCTSHPELLVRDTTDHETCSALLAPPAASARNVGNHVSVRVERHTEGRQLRESPTFSEEPAVRRSPTPARLRCLTEPPRLSQRQTERVGRAPTEVSTAGREQRGRTAGHRRPLKVDLLNVQSLLPKLPDIRADLHLRQPDIVCFTESNLKSTTPDRLLTIQDYCVFRRDRVTGRKKSGGGVIVYVRDEIHAETIKLTQVHHVDSHVEALWLKVKIDKKKAALLCCLYRPPSTSQNQIHTDFNDIEDQIQSVISLYPSHRIILAGDLNADSKTNPLAYSRLCELEKLSLNCVVNEPTFFRGDTRSMLDVILLSDAMCTANTFIKCHVERSDYSCHHRRVCLEVRVPRVKGKVSYRTTRNWRTFDDNAFLGDLARIDWSCIISRDAPCEEQWNAFSSAMLALLDVRSPAIATQHLVFGQ